ncbi:MAG TPA: peroxiredoxin [Chloroflexia bacterium]|nr:peroxiredoxin [Chloroflexia bacterium]
MPLVGNPAPDFNMQSTRNLETLEENVSLADYHGKWLVLFFYPMDFTFVCPTEITAFSDRIEEFNDLGVEVVGVSTDSKFVHKAWIETPRDKNGLGQINYPLAADQNLQVSRAYDVLIEEEGVALRGLFVIDPDGILQYQVIHNLNVGRSVDEVLRVIQALQTGGRCAANWRPGQSNI